MDPLVRLHYLDNLGVTQYVAHARLPGAKVSPVLERPHAEVRPPSSIMPDLTKAFTNPITHNNASKVTTGTPTDSAGAPRTVPPATAENASTSNIFTCQIVYWCVQDLLIIADMPRLDNPQIALLNDMLFAIKRDRVPSPNAFQWPLGKMPDRSLNAARDYFQGMLEGGILKQSNLRQILVFGAHALQLLDGEAIQENTASSKRYLDWPLVVMPELRVMLLQPICKKDSWKQLLPLVPSA